MLLLFCVRTNGMKLGKSHTQTECLLCPCRSTNIRWVLDTIQLLYLISLVHLFSCSPTALHPGFSSSNLLQSQLMTFPPAAGGNISHQMSTPWSDHHPMHNHPHQDPLSLSSNSMEEGSLLLSKASINTWLPDPLFQGLPLAVSLLSLHLRLLPKATHNNPHLLVFMPLHISSPQVWVGPIFYF